VSICVVRTHFPVEDCTFKKETFQRAFRTTVRVPRRRTGPRRRERHEERVYVYEKAAHCGLTGVGDTGQGADESGDERRDAVGREHFIIIDCRPSSSSAAAAAAAGTRRVRREVFRAQRHRATACYCHTVVAATLADRRPRRAHSPPHAPRTSSRRAVVVRRRNVPVPSPFRVFGTRRVPESSGRGRS